MLDFSPFSSVSSSDHPHLVQRVVRIVLLLVLVHKHLVANLEVMLTLVGVIATASPTEMPKMQGVGVRVRRAARQKAGEAHSESMSHSGGC